MARANGVTTDGGMSLANMSWKHVAVHEVIAELLRGETHKLRVALSPAAVAHLTPLIDSPNIADPQENHARLRLLHLIRRQLIGEIPPDTRWYEVRNLTDAELPELHVIARCGWDDPRDQNELLRVAARSPRSLTSQPKNWPRPILWGHTNAGPFTIMEGNNRLTAYVSNNQSGIAIPVLVGVSAAQCFFHMFDQCGFIANDLWR